MTCLRDEIAYNIAFAKSHLTEYGVLVGTAIIARGSERYVCAYDVHSADEEVVLSGIIKRKAKRLHADRVITLSIGERVHKDTGEKQDCIVVVIVTRITTARVVIPFLKVAKDFIFGDEQIIKDKTSQERIWHDLF
jgi:hypothetical protein